MAGCLLLATDSALLMGHSLPACGEKTTTFNMEHIQAYSALQVQEPYVGGAGGEGQHGGHAGTASAGVVCGGGQGGRGNLSIHEGGNGGGVCVTCPLIPVP